MIRIFILSIFILINSTPAFAIEKSEISFNSGVKLFKQKKYKSALSFFKKAHSQGLRSNSLYYNLGVTYYKLGFYNKAKTNFNHLYKDKNFKQIANYNLGLIAEKQKKIKMAIRYYESSIKINSDKKLSQLAEQNIDRLLQRKTSANNKTVGSVNLALGYDDNVTSVASNSPSNKSDNSLELFAYIKTPISKNTNFKANFYMLDYSTISTEDFSFFTAGVEHLINVKNWEIIPEVSFLQSKLNGSSYQSITDIKVKGKHRLNNNARLSLRYRFSNINSQNALYDYLDGERHQLRADYRKKIGAGMLRMRYQLELNNRQNSASSNYSPTRHTFRVRLKHKLKNRWSVSEEAGYRISQYGSTAGTTREDSRLRVRLAVNKKFNRDWSAGIHFIHTTNDSNIASEDYSRNKIQFFTNWDF